MFKFIIAAAAISLLAACASGPSTSTMGAGSSGKAGNSMGIHPAGGPN